MKNDEPNCGAPHGLPHGRTPSWISFVHSKACIPTKVAMAIRMRGTFWPPICKAKTSLGFGHGTVVDMRTVMYDRRKQLNTNVSLRRKIHIMAFPQETCLKVLWSEAQSVANARQRLGRRDALSESLSAISAIGFPYL